MAKKEKKGKSKKASAKPADALRDAVERTFQGASDLPAGAQKRLQDVVDEFGGALTKIREQFDEKKFFDTVDSLRDQIGELAKRVQELERDPRKFAEDVRARATGKKPAAKKAAATPAAKAPAAKKPAAKKPAAKKSAAKKPAAKKAAAKKAAAKKPAAARKTAAKKPAAKKSAARKPAAKKPAAATKPAAKAPAATPSAAAAPAAKKPAAAS